MGTRSSQKKERFTSQCPKPEPFRQSGQRGLLLRRMERAVDEIVEGLASLASTANSTVADDALSVGAAARRLSDLVARWQRHGGR